MDTKEQMDSMRKWIGSLVDENAKLKAENEKLKKMIDHHKSPHNSSFVDVLDSQPFHTLNISDDDPKKRSIVIIGLPESNCGSAIDRANYDFQSVNAVLNHLEIECIPCTVYRMGRPNRDRPRLIKVVLPTSRFQQMAVRRAPRLRSSENKGIFLRPSLTREERAQLREARLAKKSKSLRSSY
ncbi:unnamed protein product [Haemonchus placei]|uniref:Transposase_22 domain-containing protein n=1 Tax=Haemonchus placei TaxID=6290 RepID=A0A0N4WCY7_HAEPC|nr:unnamed protein product [Haemonchus placei]